MTSQLRIDCEWSSPEGPSKEIAETSAFVEIKVGGDWATRCDNSFSGSVSNRAHVSAYPLALWLASSWWRLRWEAAQQRTAQTVEWELSHRLSSAASGFVWPAITFESDGESIEVTAHPSGRATYEPLKYLAQFRHWVSASDFENAVCTFVEKVLGRLNDRGMNETPLHALWAEVSTERADATQHDFRRLEAILGFDPGEAPDEQVLEIFKLQTEAGVAAAEEIAYAQTAIGKLTTSSVAAAAASAPSGSPMLSSKDLSFERVSQQSQPWHRGYALANELRNVILLNDSCLPDQKLAELLGLKSADLGSGSTTSSLPFGIGIRNFNNSGQAKYILRSPRHVGRRFEAARMLADHLTAPASDGWLPTTSSHTARQKMQRAFAAELLCPNRELRAFMHGDSSDYRLEDAADHFGVAIDTVKHQIANHWM